ncbi:hypothetical protein BX666DRAFT_2127864 [Dichotomocladium elegans]|nr:hypothetical protein BX666DRAFT_2127864 [Dichotomocladium elegans]
MVPSSFAPSRSSTIAHKTKSPLPNQRSDSLHADPPVPIRSNVHARRLSMPDLTKLRNEAAIREAVQINTLPSGKLQIDLLNVRSDVKLKRPFVRLRMGPQRYFSSSSKDAHGNWNEGFLFTISFHNQLFDMIELDLFDKRNGWRSKTRHIGKAKLRMSALGNRDDVFLTFLPMYEYHTRRYLPAHIQLPHNFLKSHIPRFRTQEQAYYQEQHPSHRRHSMTPLVGSFQIRVRYVYQRPADAQTHDIQASVYKDPDSYSVISSVLDHSTVASSQSGRSRSSGNSLVSLSSSVNTNNTALSSVDNADTDEGSDEEVGDENESNLNEGPDFHDAMEPDVILVDSLPGNTSSSSSSSSANASGLNRANSRLNTPGSILTIDRQSSVDLAFRRQLENKLARRTESTRHMNVDNGGGYGFSRSDMETRKRVRRKNSESSIMSNNFGDKNFAFRWINESFEEVALAHPSLDRMIGFVVSPQTRILVRAVVKIFTGFGQGFRITAIQLLACLSLLQNFYADIPRLPPAEKVVNLRFLDKANYFLGHAIIAYGWRGLSYLGDYAKYLKGNLKKSSVFYPQIHGHSIDVMKTRSNKEAIVRYLKIPPEDLLGYEYGLRKGAVFQPSYFVAIDRGYEAIVLGIRGTWSLYDCITDLVCEYRPWKGGLVHSGLLASAQWFFTRIIPQIFHYVHENSKSKLRPIKSFIITGHSLGAGAAALLTMMVLDHLEELRRLSENPEFDVHCYGYAPVASVSLDISEKYKEHIDSFVCQDDLVARLSYGTASCAKELIMDAMIAVDGLGGSSKITSDGKARKACYDIIETRRQEIFYANEPRYPLLYVPGQVYQFQRLSTETKKTAATTDDAIQTRRPLFPLDRNASSRSFFSDDTRSGHFEPTMARRASSASHGRRDSIGAGEESAFTLHKGTALLSKEMLISKTCLEDHMLVTYLNAFQAVRQSCMREIKGKKQLASEGPIVPTSPTSASASASTHDISTRPLSPVPSIQIEDPEGKVEMANVINA